MKVPDINPVSPPDIAVFSDVFGVLCLVCGIGAFVFLVWVGPPE